ncbi:Polyamine transporter PUT1 [Hibiscus syriacus]|uniref:Polyamine transporter PUT1 n=1 Tax=Hibiscus syriacus TaxID=106335 RepID=A0A6A2Z4Z1_HIBSY|nr:Polyamine transporter PUT1 [Hibiscus syriacus]
MPRQNPAEMVDPSSDGAAEYVELGERSSPKLDKYQKALTGASKQGWMKWLSGVIDNALYPVLFLDYLKSAIPELEGGLPRTTAVLALTVVLTYMSYRGLNIVGWVAIFLGVFHFSPSFSWGLWLFLDWMLQGGFSGPMDISRTLVKCWRCLAANMDSSGGALSNMGMFLAEMSSDSFQLEGMAIRGMLPELFAKRSPYGTPLVGILFSASGVILLSWMSFQEIVAAENFLYCFGMIMEFIAFVKLRIDHPAESRPYKIPLGTVGSIIMCIPPTVLILVVLAFASFKVMVISMVAIMIGLVLEPCLRYSERKDGSNTP